MDNRPDHVAWQADEADQLVHYYDRLASRYDEDRFGNSYGRYLGAQERRLLQR